MSGLWQAQAPSATAWLAALRDARMCSGWTVAEWELIIRQARRLRLLGRLAESVLASPPPEGLPAPVLVHLVAEQRYSRWRMRAMSWALRRVGVAWQDATFPRVLLKGAAYVAQGLPIAQGRLPSDVDVLVPRAHLPQAHALLLGEGWAETPLDAHDQRYYREWSHEWPPLRHPLHGLELDLHHNILPPVSRTRVDAARLLARIQSSRLQGWHVLHPQDQLLHSAVHLFRESEAQDRLRDLVDMDGLVRHFAAHGLWEGLVERAEELGLTPALALCLSLCVNRLGTPVPDTVTKALGPALPAGPVRWVFDRLLRMPDPDTSESWQESVAATALAVRYHAWRMPLSILVPHLWHKWRSERAAELESPGAAGPAA